MTGARNTGLAFLAILALVSLSGCRRAGGDTIAEIQGAGHRSPLEGRSVAGVEGVVTRVREAAGRHGFWMQSGQPDSDPATSEGIFVLTGELPPPVAPGDRVWVAGKVEELNRSERELPVTVLTGPKVEVLERGQPLPPPVPLGPGGRRIPGDHVDDDSLTLFEPSEDTVDFWESVEGMRVELREPRVVQALNSYGALAIVTGDYEPDSTRGGLVLGPDHPHPERVGIDSRSARETPDWWVGDVLEGPIFGIVDYAYSDFVVRPESPLPKASSPRLSRERTELRGDREHLTVATYNALNLAGPDPEERFRRLARSLVVDLGAPDVVALQEIQDDSGAEDDGTVSAAVTLGRLLEAIEREGGPSYIASQLDPEDLADGGQPGGNIRVALLVNPDRVQLRPGAGPRRLGVGHPCFEANEEGRGGSRKSLALRLKFRGTPLYLLNNHWASKGGDDPMFGARQPPRLLSEDKRVCQAEVVAGWVKEILEADPDAAVIVLGDLNEYEYRPPLEALRLAGLLDLIDDVARTDRYTYVYRGQAGALDHVLVSSVLVAREEPEVDIVHVNADFPASDRASDHDPVVVRLRIGG